VRFTGYVDDGDLPVLYSLATAFVFPSSYEGFGLPPLEAMACGTPVISNGATAMPEVIGDAGLLLDRPSPEAIADAMERLISDNDLRRRLVERGFERAAAFSWDAAGERCSRLYDNYARESKCG
jgi:glycosyltransferase involved in cell wall biosynthesis